MTRIAVTVAMLVAGGAVEMAANAQQVADSRPKGGNIERDTGGGNVVETSGEGIPDSPRGRKAMAVVDALRDGSPEALQALVNEHFSPGLRDGYSLEQHLEILGELSADVRSATDLNVQPAGELTIELTTVNAAGDRAVYVVELEEQPPHGIAGIRLR